MSGSLLHAQHTNWGLAPKALGQPSLSGHRERGVRQARGDTAPTAPAPRQVRCVRSRGGPGSRCPRFTDEDAAAHESGQAACPRSQTATESDPRP